jgi:CubicO group peptidase (beta-lactamase class C family)
VTPALAPVAAALEAGRAAGIAPALAAAVLRDGALVHASWHGEVPAPAPRPLRRDDVFDVASLTKVMATTTLAAQLVSEGRLALDGPAAAALPGLEAAGKGDVTVRQLLAHASGLPRWRPYFERAARDPEAAPAFLTPGERPPSAALAGAFERARALVSAAALAEPLEAPPGARAEYGDPAFIVLGLLLERLTGTPLAGLAEARVFGPLGLASTFFLDGRDPGAAAARAAGRTFVPTGWCPLRRETTQGVVNDANAYAMGGVAGHAGLFSSALDTAALGQAWLDAVHGRPSPVPAAVAAEFTRRDAAPASERALGWDTPSRGTSSLGTRLGRGRRGAIGHLGFTGTSLWIDLDAALVCALLTNHVHPSGTNDKARLRAFRGTFHDAVAEALGIG